MAAEHLNTRLPKKPKRKPGKAVVGRRALVSGMLIRRVTQGKIAKALGVSRMTNVKDVKAIEAEWRDDMMANVTSIKARELAELSAVEAEAWQGFQRSHPKTAPVVKGQPIPPQPPGDPKWLKVILDVKKRRSDLLGLDAPIEVRHGLADMDLRAMSDDELTELEHQIATGVLDANQVLH